MAVFKVIEPRAGRLQYRLFLRQTWRALVLLLGITLVCAAGVFLLDQSAASNGAKIFDALWNAANTVTPLGDLTSPSRGQKTFMIVAMLSVITIGGYAISSFSGILTSSE